VDEVYKERREKVYELLNAINCSFDTNQAGLFIWAKIPDSYEDGFALSDEVLYQSNVFITPGGIFGSAGNKYVRVSLCSTSGIFEQAIQRIKK
jgi:aspartate/methionine/tyrosine aminotransferase